MDTVKCLVDFLNNHSTNLKKTKDKKKFIEYLKKSLGLQSETSDDITLLKYLFGLQSPGLQLGEKGLFIGVKNVKIRNPFYESDIQVLGKPHPKAFFALLFDVVAEMANIPQRNLDNYTLNQYIRKNVLSGTSLNLCGWNAFSAGILGKKAQTTNGFEAGL